jgi:hypothetical protein
VEAHQQLPPLQLLPLPRLLLLPLLQGPLVLLPELEPSTLAAHANAHACVELLPSPTLLFKVLADSVACLVSHFLPRSLASSTDNQQALCPCQLSNRKLLLPLFSSSV